MYTIYDMSQAWDVCNISELVLSNIYMYKANEEMLGNSFWEDTASGPEERSHIM